MTVDPGARLRAILFQRCPRCLEGPVFESAFRMRQTCPGCRVVFAREDGYFTGAMIFSYVLAVPALGILFVLLVLVAGLRIEWALAGATLGFLPLLPGVFRYSRVLWMHLDRLVDGDPDLERYADVESSI